MAESVPQSDWYKSSFSNGGACVEMRRAKTEIQVRDTKDRLGPVLTFNRQEWQAFLDGVRAGEFDLPD